MSFVRLAFERAVKIHRLAMEFPTEEALQRYLKEHPGADKSLHTVKEDKEAKKKEEKSKTFEYIKDSARMTGLSIKHFKQLVKNSLGKGRLGDLDRGARDVAFKYYFPKSSTEEDLKSILSDSLYGHEISPSQRKKWNITEDKIDKIHELYNEIKSVKDYMRKNSIPVHNIVTEYPDD